VWTAEGLVGRLSVHKVGVFWMFFSGSNHPFNSSAAKWTAVKLDPRTPRRNSEAIGLWKQHSPRSAFRAGGSTACTLKIGVPAYFKIEATAA
jgi:hypothetical protein